MGQFRLPRGGEGLCEGWKLRWDARLHWSLSVHPLGQGVTLRLSLSCHLRKFWTQDKRGGEKFWKKRFQKLENSCKKERSWPSASAWDVICEIGNCNLPSFEAVINFCKLSNAILVARYQICFKKSTVYWVVLCEFIRQCMSEFMYRDQ